MRSKTSYRIGTANDLGFEYSRHIADLEGHMWEPMWMDPAAAAGGLGEVPSGV